MDKPLTRRELNVKNYLETQFSRNEIRKMYARLMAGLYIDSDLSRVPVRLRNKAAEADIEVALDVVVRGWWFLNRTKRTEKKTEK